MTNSCWLMGVCGSLLVCVGCGAGDSQESLPGPSDNAREPLSDATRYTITSVQPLSGDTSTTALAINDSGTVTGSSWGGPTQRAIRAASGAATENLGTLPKQPNSIGAAINASGQVAGRCSVSTVNMHACLYTDGKGWIDLGLFNVGGEDPTTQPSSASGINTSGTVSGIAPWLDPVSFGQFNHAFSYAAGKKTDLGSLLGADGSSSGAAINDSGLVVGTSSTSTGTHAAAFSGTAITDLGLLPGATSSAATSVNSSGHIVGSATRPNCKGYHCSPTGFIHAFLYTAAGGLADLGTLGGVVSNAFGVDAHDNVVGSSTATGTTIPNMNHADPNRLAFLYTNGKMVDLNTRIDATGWILRDAVAINAKGQIVGNGTLNGVTLGFVLTPR